MWRWRSTIWRCQHTLLFHSQYLLIIKGGPSKNLFLPILLSHPEETSVSEIRNFWFYILYQIYLESFPLTFKTKNEQQTPTNTTQKALRQSSPASLLVFHAKGNFILPWAMLGIALQQVVTSLSLSTCYLYVFTRLLLYWNSLQITKLLNSMPWYAEFYKLLFALEASQSCQIPHVNLLKVEGQISVKWQEIFIHLTYNVISVQKSCYFEI